MKRNLKTMMLLLCCIVSMGASAQDTHWTVNPHDFQYDMTAYVALTADGEAVTDYSSYEVAAFCGDELRGVSTVQTVGTTSYAYLRIYSNATEGETITFKVFVKDISGEVEVKDFSMPFVAQSVQGLPSSPVVLDFIPYIPGDADGDGVLDLTDAVAIFEFYMNGEYPNFVEVAADYDGDGVVDLTDAVLIFEYYMNQ